MLQLIGCISVATDKTSVAASVVVATCVVLISTNFLLHVNLILIISIEANSLLISLKFEVVSKHFLCLMMLKSRYTTGKTNVD